MATEQVRIALPKDMLGMIRSGARDAIRELLTSETVKDAIAAAMAELAREHVSSPSGEPQRRDEGKGGPA